MTTTTSRTVEVDRPAGPVADHVRDFGAAQVGERQSTERLATRVR